MKFSLRTLLIIVTLVPPLFAGTLHVARKLRYARQRAACVNGVKEKLPRPSAKP